jgi:hypothetical protein
VQDFADRRNADDIDEVQTNKNKGTLCDSVELSQVTHSEVNSFLETADANKGKEIDPLSLNSSALFGIGQCGQTSSWWSEDVIQ